MRIRIVLAVGSVLQGRIMPPPGHWLITQAISIYVPARAWRCMRARTYVRYPRVRASSIHVRREPTLELKRFKIPVACAAALQPRRFKMPYSSISIGLRTTINSCMRCSAANGAYAGRVPRAATAHSIEATVHAAVIDALFATMLLYLYTVGECSAHRTAGRAIASVLGARESRRANRPIRGGVYGSKAVDPGAGGFRRSIGPNAATHAKVCHHACIQ